MLFIRCEEHRGNLEADHAELLPAAEQHLHRFGAETAGGGHKKA